MGLQLDLYNDALLKCGADLLEALTDNVEARYVMDRVWARDPIRYCLERGEWAWSIKTVQMDFDPSIEPAFGLRFGFEKPDDWLRTSAISLDAYFNQNLTAYADEQGYWFCDSQVLYVKHVSDDDDYGRDSTLWSTQFREFITTYMAVRAFRRIRGSGGAATQDLEILKKELKTMESQAQNLDGMNRPTRFPSPGTFTLARAGSGRFGSRNGSGRCW